MWILDALVAFVSSKTASNFWARCVVPLIGEIAISLCLPYPNGEIRTSKADLLLLAGLVLLASLSPSSQGHDWFKTPIDIEVSQASTSALNAVQQTGGKIKLVYYNGVGMRAMLSPEKFAPHTTRRLPYLTIPRVNINRKLLHPMEQPEQLPGWVEAQNALRDAIQSSGAGGKQTL